VRLRAALALEAPVLGARAAALLDSPPERVSPAEEGGRMASAGDIPLT